MMIWGMSQVYANPGFLDGVSSYLVAPTSSVIGYVLSRFAPVCKLSYSFCLCFSSKTATMLTTITTKATTMTAKATTTTSTSATATTTGSGTVGQWNQCAGEGWTGGIVCVSP